MAQYDAFVSDYDEALKQRTQALLALLDLQAVHTCYRDAANSQVYLVEDHDHRQLILKCGRAERAESLQVEYALLSRLDHPAIPKAIRFVAGDEWTYLLREYVPGNTLDAYAQSGIMSLPQAVSIMQKACAVIMYLHTQSPPVIHRDIKPENFIVTFDGQLMLIDLDTTQAFKPDKGHDTLFMGTKAIAAPEQYGARRSDMRTDVYGLGMLFLFLLTNQYELSALASLQLPRSVYRIIQKSTSFDPDRRYTTVRKLYIALGHVRFRSDAEKRSRRALLTSLLAIVCLLTGYLLGSLHAMLPRPSAFNQSQLLMNKTAEGLVPFQNLLFAQAAALQLDKPAHTLTYDDLTAVTHLYISGSVPLKEVTNYGYYTPDSMDYWREIDYPLEYLAMPGIDALDDLQYFPNLQHLGLYQQRITDINILSGMRLEMLALCGCPVEDFSPIAGMDTLKSLDIAYTNASDASFLSGLTALEHLRVDGTQIL